MNIAEKETNKGSYLTEKDIKKEKNNLNG